MTCGSELIELVEVVVVCVTTITCVVRWAQLRTNRHDLVQEVEAMREELALCTGVAEENKAALEALRTASASIEATLTRHSRALTLDNLKKVGR